MSRSATLVALAASVFVSLPTVAQAGGCGGGRRWKPTPLPIVVHPQPIVRPAPRPVPAPQLLPTPIPAPTPAPTWYFGVSLQQVPTAYGTGLQVASVTPGSPAATAGLEPGDVLLAAGSTSLTRAVSNQHGVQMIQAVVTEMPAPTFTTVSTGAAPTVGSVLLTTLDARSGQPTYVTVHPTRSAVATPPAATFPPAPTAVTPTFSPPRFNLPQPTAPAAPAPAASAPTATSRPTL